MSRFARRSGLTIFFLGLALGVGASSAVAIPPGPGSIQGTVTDPNSNPLANICVVAESGGPAHRTSTVTDANGNYTLSNLATGRHYVVRFDNNGDCGAPPNPGNWASQWWNGEPAAIFADLVAVRDPTPVTGINAQMQPGGAISGTVVSAVSGAPLGGICVAARPLRIGRVGTTGGTTTTDSSGNYSFHNLPEALYTVGFSGCNGNSWVPQWWESAGSAKDATQVDLFDGETVNNVSAAMTPAGTIRGVVTGSGQPLAGICVVVDTGQPGPAQYTAVTRNKGNYALTGLPVGHSYKIRFDNDRDCGSGGNPGSWVTQWWNGAASFAAATPVNITGTAPVNNVNADMSPGGSISGTVTGNGSPQQDICVSIDTGRSGGGVIEAVQTAPDGTYSLPNLTIGSSYVIRFDGYSCFQGFFGVEPWLTQWYNGTVGGASTFAGGTGVTVPSGIPVKGIDATLASGAGAIVGLTSQASGSGDGGPPISLPGICVTVQDSASGAVLARGQSGESLFGPFPPPGSPNYQIQGLPPAIYNVRFDSCNGAAGNWVKQRIHNVFVSNGGLTTDVDATLVPFAALTIGPNSGPVAGGTTVTISGTGLTGAKAVMFGSTSATPTVLADNLLTVVTPPHAAGTVPVSVVVSSGTTNSLSFTYQ